MRRTPFLSGVSCLTAICGVLAFAPPVLAAGTVRPGRALVPQRQQQLQVAAQALQGIEFPTTVRTLVGKAQPDECFVAPDDPGNVYPATPPCASGVPKVNQGYAWSMVEAGGNVWFGTVANPLCAVLGVYLGVLGAVETNSFVCELTGGNPLDDLRPPQIWLHRPPPINTLENKTPVSALVLSTAGMRAAGAHGGVVLIGGPRLSPSAGLNLFAYDAATRNFISAATVGGMAPPQAADYTVYTDIRTFLVANGELYAGVRYELRDMTTGAPKERGGKVLRWTGNAGSPFTFVEVATLDTEAAYLAHHEGRLFASTWPVVDPASIDPFPANVVLAGVFMSPDPVDGVFDAGDGAWTKEWQVDDYEPDPLVAATYAGGAIASFDGYLFWGTMHVPFVATIAHFQAYASYYSLLDDSSTPTIQEAVIAAMLGTQRTGKVFRGAGFTTSPTIDLLYGLPALPAFTYDSGTPANSSWSLTANGMGGAPPMWGLPGFGNLLNNYIWAMQAHNGRLWVGTMDWSFLVYDLATALLEDMLGEDLEIPPGVLPALLEEYLQCLLDAEDTATTFGGDLYYFPGGDRPAFPESIGGVGNYTSYGVRSMASAPSGLYVGMANPMNLLTDTTDDVPEGGWEVLRLVDRPQNTPVGDYVVVTLDDGTTVTLCGVDEPGYTVGTWVPTPCCGSWLPVPAQFAPPQQMLLLGSSALLSEDGGCSSTGPVTVCMPISTGVARLYQPVLAGSPPSVTVDWVDITTGYDNNRVCGQLQEGSQALLQQLGYQGYLGVVVGLQYGVPVPATSPWALGVLALVLAAAGAVALRGRIG